jgi:uncharacterized membrane protein HdeD (DUF308 family)
MSLRNVDRVSTILLGASLLSLIYGIGRLYNEVNLTAFPWIAVLLLATFIAGVLFLSLFLRFRRKPEVAILAISLVLSFVAGNIVLGQTGRDLIDIIDAKLGRDLR